VWPELMLLNAETFMVLIVSCWGSYVVMYCEKTDNWDV